MTTENPEEAVNIYVPKRSIYLLPIILQISEKNVTEYIEKVGNGWKLREKGYGLLMVKMIRGKEVEGFEKCGA